MTTPLKDSLLGLRNWLNAFSPGPGRRKRGSIERLAHVAVQDLEKKRAEPQIHVIKLYAIRRLLHKPIDDKLRTCSNSSCTEFAQVSVKLSLYRFGHFKPLLLS